jgi:hypothetical protein
VAVFVDEEGRRARWVRRAGTGVGLACLAYLLLLGAALVGVPWVPRAQLPGVATVTPRHQARPPSLGPAAIRSTPVTAPSSPSPAVTTTTAATTTSRPAPTPTSTPTGGPAPATTTPAVATTTSTTPGRSGTHRTTTTPAPSTTTTRHGRGRP